MRTDTYCQLYHPEQVISGNGYAANKYARDHSTVGKKIVDLVLGPSFASLWSTAPSLGGLPLLDHCHHATGGGTGSGLGSIIHESFSVYYGSKPKLSFAVSPTSQGQRCS